MKNKQEIPDWKQQGLFTSVLFPISTSVKQAMLKDFGYDDEFMPIVRDIRRRILEIGQVADLGYEAILLQGSGACAVEAVVSTGTPPDGKWLVIQNGALGARIAKIVDVLKIRKTVLNFPGNSLPDVGEIYKTLKEDPLITHVAIVHNEITTGLINPIKEIGEIVKRFKKIYFVDAGSSFGAVRMNFEELKIDWLASVADQSIEGMSGIAFAVAKKDILLATEGNARSYTLDLLDQWNGFEKYGQFRFASPAHSVHAFRQALIELEEEGGVFGRETRYKKNYQTLVEGMRALGFTEFLAPELQVHSVVSFKYPEHRKFDTDKFYKTIKNRSYAIYPGTAGKANYFRLAFGGRIYESDVLELLGAIKETMEEMSLKK
ncbi:MAG: 2-aminoethylphosphonate--pyruvate transaminase [Calditrichaeota bacterium]|nr:2-aminoethylphosphonate--pyruvate transaminase [Calditrichota bacterium]